MVTSAVVAGATAASWAPDRWHTALLAVGQACRAQGGLAPHNRDWWAFDGHAPMMPDLASDWEANVRGCPGTTTSTTRQQSDSDGRYAESRAIERRVEG